MNTLVVVNPHSANGLTGRKWPQIRQALALAVGPFDEAQTQCQGHATELVRDGLRHGVQRVVAVGGDGTTNEVVNGFFANGHPINPQAALGFVPRGTGGDLRRTLGIDRDLEFCVQVLAADRRIDADLGVATFAGHDGQTKRRHFINITSFGIAGLVDAKVNRSSKALGGRVSFMLGTFRALLEYRNQSIRLLVKDGQATVLDDTMTVNNIAVANGQYFGGGMWVAPEANVTDGKFDVVILGDLKFFEVLFRTPRIYKGTHLSMPKVRHLRGTRVEATSAAEVLIDMDGEQPGRLPITLDILPKAIQLIVPDKGRS